MAELLVTKDCCLSQCTKCNGNSKVRVCSIVTGMQSIAEMFMNKWAKFNSKIEPVTDDVIASLDETSAQYVRKSLETPGRIK